MYQTTGRQRITGALLLAGVLLTLVGLWGSLRGRQPALESTPGESSVLELAGLTEIDLDTAFCNIEIVAQGNRSYLTASGFEPNTLTHSVKNGRLAVRQKSPKKLITSRLRGFMRGEGLPLQSGVLVITIAEGTRLQDLEIDLGAGNLSLAGLTAEEAAVEIGAGELIVENSAFKEVSLESGAGSIHLKNTTATEKIVAQNGTGNILLEASTAGNLTLSTGAGNITASLKGRQEDYSIQASCGLGQARIGQNHHGKEVTLKNPGAAFSLKAECGAGNIDIDFS